MPETQKGVSQIARPTTKSRGQRPNREAGFQDGSSQIEMPTLHDDGDQIEDS
jgi:hypothetical protein